MVDGMCSLGGTRPPITARVGNQNVLIICPSRVIITGIYCFDKKKLEAPLKKPQNEALMFISDFF